MNRLSIVMLLAILTLSVFAQKVKTVEGEYTYHAPESVSPTLAKKTALEQAMIKAIGDEFGYYVSQTNLTRIEQYNEQSKSQFISLGSSDVRGIWIETIGKPSYKIDQIPDGDGDYIVTCKVKGKAREILSSQIDFMAKILRNGARDEDESDTFKNGNHFCLAFQSPVSGYIAVYMVDADNQVQCLLPSEKEKNGFYEVKANNRYVFFAPDEYHNGYRMITSREQEYNQMYVIFSPNKYVKANDNPSQRKAIKKDKTSLVFPRELSYEDFHKWLSKCRRNDKDMVLKKMVITIKK